MRMILPGLLFLVSLWTAASLSETLSLPQVLTEFHKNPVQAYKMAESLYNSTSDEAEAARLATLLAFAPEGTTKVPAPKYAQYSFSHDKEISNTLKIKMAKLAGESLFNNSQFSQANSIYSQALNVPGIDESDQEHFHYQMAWCDLNLKKPKAAVTRLQNWLKSCKTCRLKTEMARDLGKAWIETKELSPRDLDSSLHLSFIEGLSQELGRKKNFELHKVTNRFQDEAFRNTWLTAILNGSLLKSLSSCERLSALAETDIQTVPTPIFRSPLRECVKQEVHAKKMTISEKLLMTLLNDSLDKESVDHLWLSEMEWKRGQTQQACHSRMKAGRLNLEIPAHIYLQSLVKACSQKDLLSTEAEDLFSSSELLALTLKLKEESLMEVLLQPEIPFSFRLRVWRSAPDELAVKKNLLEEMARSASKELSAKEALDVLSEASQRKRAPAGYIALLRSRVSTDSKLEIKIFANEERWEELSEEEKSELLIVALKNNGVHSLLNDWKTWDPRLSAQPDLATAFLEALAIADLGTAPTQLLKSKSPLSVVAKAIPQLKTSTAQKPELKTALNEMKELPIYGDLNQVVQLSEKAKPLVEVSLIQAAGSHSLESQVESHLDLSAKLVKGFSKFKWKSKGLQDLSRKLIKEGLAHLQRELIQTANLDTKYADYLEVSKLLKDWEKKL